MSSVEFSELRVLVIDDHAFVRHTICEMLSPLGLKEVAEAADGIETLTRLKEDPVPFGSYFATCNVRHQNLWDA